MAFRNSALSSAAPVSWLSGMAPAVNDEGDDILADDFLRFAFWIISEPVVMHFAVSKPL
jgi:hypothetical protein